MASILNVFTTLFTGATSEFLGKMGVEAFKGNVGKLTEQKIQEQYEKKKKLEEGRSRIIHALADNFDPNKGINRVGNLLRWHEMASRGQLTDLKGKSISENRLIFFLSHLDPERLDDTLQWLNELPEEKFRQMLEIMDEDQWGDKWWKFKNHFKNVFPLVIEFLSRTGVIDGWDLGKRTKGLIRDIRAASKRAQRDAMDSEKKLKKILKSKQTTTRWW